MRLLERILCNTNSSTTSLTSTQQLKVKQVPSVEAKQNGKEASQVFLLVRSIICRGTNAKDNKKGVVVKEISHKWYEATPTECCTTFPTSPIFQGEGAVEANPEESSKLLQKRCQPGPRTIECARIAAWWILCSTVGSNPNLKVTINLYLEGNQGWQR